MIKINYVIPFIFSLFGISTHYYNLNIKINENNQLLKKLYYNLDLKNKKIKKIYISIYDFILYDSEYIIL